MKPSELAARLRTRLDSCSTSTFTAVLLLAFVGFSLVTVANHEMWRDELQAWGLAAEASSLKELWLNTRYEGHPALWFLILFALNKITGHPAIMQLAHLGIAASTVFILARFAPFSRFQKVLLAFGYFFIYEYNVISRDYAIGILLIFSFCAVFRPRGASNYCILAILLAFLAQTNIYGLMFSISLALMLVFEFAVDRSLLKELPRRKLEISFSVALILIGFACSILWILPPSDSALHVEWMTEIQGWRIQKTLASVWNSYVPIPALTYQWWNSNILEGDTLPAILSLAFLATGVLWFARKLPALFLFCTGSAGMLLFTYVKFLGYPRHHGHLFALLLVCLWLYEYFPETPARLRVVDRLHQISMRSKKRVLETLLIVHCAVGISVCVVDWWFPFSESENVAEYIKASHMDLMPTIGDSDAAASPIAIRLGREFYYPKSERFGTYIIWDDKRRNWLPQSEALAKADWLADRSGTDVLLVLNYKLNPRFLGGDYGSIVELEEFVDNIAPNEDYHLYLYEHAE